MTVSEIRELLWQSRQKVAAQVNQELLQLSKILTKELGKGFSRSNLQNMRLLYLNYQKCQTLSGKLSWSHYGELLSISDKDRRSFYEKEAENASWSVRELKRQVMITLQTNFMEDI